MRVNVKKIVLLSICAAISLMILLGLLFNVVQVSNKGEVALNDNGYTLLSFESEFITSIEDEWCTIVSGIFNLLIALSGIGAVAMSVYSIIKCDKSYVFPIIVIVMGIVTSVLYMIEGVIFAGVVKSTLNSLYTKYIHTVSFVPMIIQAVLTIAYILCLKLIPENAGETYREKPTVKNESLDQAAKKLEILMQYKELLDSGAITQEEYEEQKKKWL